MLESPAVIQTQDLYKTYSMGVNQVQALQEVSLDIHANEYVAIMGPSGSGKSTLMNIIGCLDVPSSGQYILNGKHINTMDDDQLAYIRSQDIGFVFQTFHLLPRANALRNVELPLIYSGVPTAQRYDKAIQALAAVGLSDRLDHRPNELSGGQRQRVAIARALVNNPSIILADEPTGALDTRTGAEIMELFEQLHAAGNTLILVTHEEHVAQYAQRIIRFRDGRIESDQTVAAVFGEDQTPPPAKATASANVNHPAVPRPSKQSQLLPPDLHQTHLTTPAEQATTTYASQKRTTDKPPKQHTVSPDPKVYTPLPKSYTTASVQTQPEAAQATLATSSYHSMSLKAFSTRLRSQLSLILKVLYLVVMFILLLGALLAQDKIHQKLAPSVKPLESTLPTIHPAKLVPAPNQ